MNEKINIQNLTDDFAESYGINRKEAEAFIKNFFSVIEEGLEKDKVVKIKGLGTFKLIEVDSRESINVNTGERFEIQGHSKVTFTPDNNLKEAVNKPFSAFQTVVLAEGVSIDAPEESLADALSDDFPDEEPAVVEEPTPEVEAEPVAEEPAEVEDAAPVVEEEAMFEEEPAAPVEETPVAEEPAVVEETPAVEEEPAVVEEPTPEVEAEPVAEEPSAAEEPVAEQSTAETQKESFSELQTKILQMFDDEAIKKKDQPVSHQQEVMALKLSEEKRKEISRKAERSSTPYIMFLAVLAIMACLGIVAYIYFPHVAQTEQQPTINQEEIDDFRRGQSVPKEEATPAATETPAAEPAVEVPVRKEITQPITVREESVPAPTASQSAAPTPASATPAPAAQPAAQPTPQAAPKPAAAPSSARTIKVGNNTYAYDGEIETHVLQQGETLYSLARQYYKSNAMYAVIVDYNKDVIKNPDNVPSGTKLRIPKVVKK